jgi:hypothetical protein
VGDRFGQRVRNGRILERAVDMIPLMQYIHVLQIQPVQEGN